MKKTVLIANCGSIALGPSLVKILKSIKETDFRVVGIDCNQDSAGPLIVDKFYKSPRGNSKEFVPFLLEICKNEKVDIILPTSIENVSFPILDNISLFERMGVKILSCDRHILNVANNKIKMLKHLKNLNIPKSKFFVPASADEFLDMAIELGYPERDVVVKPSSLSGNRGFKILSDTRGVINSIEDLMSKPDINPYIKASEYYEIVRKSKKFPEILMMEYLPGQDYSVYVYAQNGVARSVVPMKRLKPKPGVSLISQVHLDRKIIELAKKITSHFCLNFAVNLQMKISESGEPMLYEINPRIAGTITLTQAAGANHLKYAINDLLGIENNFIKPKDGVIMYRYLSAEFLGN